jgi:hypothetical protein
MALLITLFPLSALAETCPQAAEALAEMKASITRNEFRDAAAQGRWAIFQQKEYNGAPLPEEEPIYWDMLPPDMQNVVLAHGGTRLDNLDSRPSDWKLVDKDAHKEMWVYKTGDAVVTTYIFQNGKLIQTIKP